MDKQTRNEAEAEAIAGVGADRGTTMEGQIEVHSLAQGNSSSESTKDTLIGSKTSVEDAAAPVTKEGPPAADPEASRTKLQVFIIMLSLSSYLFFVEVYICPFGRDHANPIHRALDTTIITTALPTISEHFHSNAGYTWIGSAYLLTNAASTPSWGNPAYPARGRRNLLHREPALRRQCEHRNADRGTDNSRKQFRRVDYFGQHLYQRFIQHA